MISEKHGVPSIGIGRRIRDERMALGLTIEGFAELIDKSSSYTGLLERGQRTPSLETLYIIAATLNTSAGKILSESEPDSINHAAAVKNSRKKLDTYTNKLDDDQLERLIQVIKAVFSFK